MRTTVTLDPDTAAMVKKAMQERDVTFKQAVNDLIRAGRSAGRRPATVKLSTSDMGEPFLDVTKALAVSAQIEDAELTRKLTAGR